MWSWLANLDVGQKSIPRGRSFTLASCWQFSRFEGQQFDASIGQLGYSHVLIVEYQRSAIANTM